MDSPLQLQQGGISNDIPLAIHSQELEVEKIKTLSRLPAHRRRTDAEALGHLVCRSQPLQRIEGSERVEIDQRR